MFLCILALVVACVDLYTSPRDQVLKISEWYPLFFVQVRATD